MSGYIGNVETTPRNVKPSEKRVLSCSAPATGSVRKLEASLGAIHYHSGRGFEDKIEAIAILKSIHEECEIAMPILKTVKEQNNYVHLRETGEK